MGVTEDFLMEWLDGIFLFVAELNHTALLPSIKSMAFHGFYWPSLCARVQ